MVVGFCMCAFFSLKICCKHAWYIGWFSNRLMAVVRLMIGIYTSFGVCAFKKHTSAHRHIFWPTMPTDVFHTHARSFPVWVFGFFFLLFSDEQTIVFTRCLNQRWRKAVPFYCWQQIAPIKTRLIVKQNSSQLLSMCTCFIEKVNVARATESTLWQVPATYAALLWSALIAGCLSRTMMWNAL